MHYITLLLLLFPTVVYGNQKQSSATSNTNMRLVNTAVAGIYVEPDTNSSYDSQKLYGHWIEITASTNADWVKTKSDDEIENYMQVKDLIADNPAWRTSKQLWQVCSLTACVYPTPSVRRQTMIRLPYNAYIKFLEFSKDGKWAHVELIDQTKGWVVRGDIEPIQTHTLDTMLKRVQQFLDLPYIWGGTSSQGYDCSGLTQLIARQLGYPMQRNATTQAKDPSLLPVSYENIQPGDFVYFSSGGKVDHAAFCIAPNKIIHAATLNDEDKVMITSINHPRLIFNCARRLPALPPK
jgi:cell wall-associated NlpC family hydrolase